MPFPVSNIREVCKERKTTLAEVERALGIGNGVIARWENAKKSPPYNKIVDIATLLDVPVERLTGEIKVPDFQSDQSKKIQRVGELFSRLSEQQQKDFLLQLEAVARSQPDPDDSKAKC